ncbi:MAG: hypothetical protein SGILL_000784 [Bacillariaceae sp.]
MKSPAPKKRNTAKTPNRGKAASTTTTTATHPQREIPLSSRKSIRRSRAAQAPPVMVAQEETVDEDEIQAAIQPSRSNANTGAGMFSTFHSSVDRFVATVQENFSKSPFASTEGVAPTGTEPAQEERGGAEDVADNGVETETVGILSTIKSSMNILSATIRDKAMNVNQKTKSAFAPLSQRQQENEAEESTGSEDTSTPRSSRARSSNDSFYRGRKFLWYFLLLCSFLCLVLGVLWVSVVTYDVTDLTLEINQCERSLKKANRKVASTSSEKDKFRMNELERKSQYWKTQAKRNEAYAVGYKKEYQAILKQLEGVR